MFHNSALRLIETGQPSLISMKTQTPLVPSVSQTFLDCKNLENRNCLPLIIFFFYLSDIETNDALWVTVDPESEAVSLGLSFVFRPLKASRPVSKHMHMPLIELLIDQNWRKMSNVFQDLSFAGTSMVVRWQGKENERGWPRWACCFNHTRGCCTGRSCRGGSQNKPTTISAPNFYGHEMGTQGQPISDSPAIIS